MKIYSICFNHDPSQENPILCAQGNYTLKNGLSIKRIKEWSTLKEFEFFLEQKGPWIAGVDFPVSQSWNFIKKISSSDKWNSFIQAVTSTQKEKFEKEIKIFSKKASGGNNALLRITDTMAQSSNPLSLGNNNPAFMFYEGVKRLKKAGVSIPPCHVIKTNRIVVETSPGLIANRFTFKYKNPGKKFTAQQNIEDARKIILNSIKTEEFESEFGFIVNIDSSIALMSVEDNKGRYIDSVMGMIQAAWAYSKKNKNYGIPSFNHPVIQSEGWIADPSLGSSLNSGDSLKSFELGKLIQTRNSSTDRKILNIITQVKRLSNIGRSLSGELNLDALLEIIVSEARELTNADGGTLYIIENNSLVFKIVQNESLNIVMGGTSGVNITFPPVEMKESNVSAYVAMRGITVNIADVYNYKPFDFTGPKNFDQKTGYRTKSMLVVPLRNYDGMVIGVLQILNARDPRIKTKVISFSTDLEGLVESIASQAAVAISNATLISDMQGANSELIETRNQALEASRAKSTFLANMSHELRTPMNAIIGYSEMLIEDAEDQGLHEIKEDLCKIQQSGKHLLGLINEILDLSKIEAGKMEIHVESIKVEDMIDEITGTVALLLKKNSNTLKTTCPKEVGVIQTDPVRFRQIVMNLLSNAAKFTQNGNIYLNLFKQFREGQSWMGVEIKDTGIGIPKDQIQNLFDEFTQADPSSTRQYGGTGLGLTISRRLCRLLGGEIFVKSEIGVGSTFTIFLPYKVTQKAFPKRRSSDLN